MKSTLTKLLKKLNDPAAIVSTDGRIVFANGPKCALLGYSPEELAGRPLAEIFAPGTPFKPDENWIIGVASNGGVSGVEATLEARDRGAVSVVVSASSLEGPGGERVLVFTARAREDERHNLGEARHAVGSDFISIVDKATEGIIVVDGDGVVRYSNPSAEDLLERTTYELRGQVLGLPVLTGQVAEIKILRRDNSPGVAEMLAKETRWQGRPAYLILLKDITDRKTAEEELVRNEALFETIFRSAGDAIIYSDANRVMVQANRSMTEMFGYTAEELVGRTTKMLYADPSEYEKQGRERFNSEAGERLKPYEVRYRRKNGETFTGETVGSVVRDARGRHLGYRGIIRDITDRKRMEEELNKAQKLDSLGILAGGIAHDFNNLLTGVLANISLAMHGMDRTTTPYGRLAEAETATLRAKNLTQQLLTFSRGGAPVKETLDLAALLKESVPFSLRGTNVTHDLIIVDDLCNVEADEGQIAQVINNLVINGSQAMPEGGTITVSARNVVVGADSAWPLPEGRYVAVSITDRGTGIPEKYLQKIFDPYFTTKDKGSGLGLATTYSIIKSHDGHIDVRSTYGVGTTFDIFLPASKSARPKEADSRDELIRGSGRVLVMDDEEVILNVAGTILTMLGYETVTVADGDEAVEAFGKARDEGEPFDLVILDLTVPGGKGGEEAVREILEIDPGARAIVSSGYSNGKVMSDYAGYGFSGVVTKPYLPSELGKAVADAISVKGREQGPVDG